jgi:hypothetical protein
MSDMYKPLFFKNKQITNSLFYQMNAYFIKLF